MRINNTHGIFRLFALVLLSLAALLTLPKPIRMRRIAHIGNVPASRILHASHEPQNWLTYSGSYASTRYSELTELTPGNVKGLRLQWVLPALDHAGHEETTPLVVDGTMYTVQKINDVAAVDAASGQVIWTYSHKPAAAARNCCGQMTRGLAIVDRRLFLATLDARLIALDAATGIEVWNTPVANPRDRYAFTHAPLVIGDKVIEGTAGGEFGIRGFIAAFNVNTGKEVWRFHTVPGPGEPGFESWAGDSWKHGGAPVWLTGSYDPETNLTFWGVGNPGPDFNGDGRAGDNLYSCSVIALDAGTGKLKWHFQFSPHNEFDWDSAQIPVLADLIWKGTPRKVMLWANRNGMFYVLDRTNGAFLSGKPFVKVNWATDFDETGRRLLSPSARPLRTGERVYPDELGATNWYSPSYSPRTALFYVPIRENSSSVVLRGNRPPEYRRGQPFAGVVPHGRASNAGVYSAIRAIDPLTNARKWDFRPGGTPIRSGILTTASDLLFSGDGEGRFYALDARNGEVLWQAQLDSPVSAGPVTYSAAGRQYVSIQARASLFTFALDAPGR